MPKSRCSAWQPVPHDAIAAVAGEEGFLELLRSEFGWPVPGERQRLAEVGIPPDLQRDFGCMPEEDRIVVSRLLNGTEEHPWGVFLFAFKATRPYLSHLRRLLRVLLSHDFLQKGDLISARHDLLVIGTHDWRQFQFVHCTGDTPASAVISSFGWEGPQDPFLNTLCKHNLPRLRMPRHRPGDGCFAESWQRAWREAFNPKPVAHEFYATLREMFEVIQEGISGLTGENRLLFAQLVINRLVFLKFVEHKGWLDADREYLFNRFQAYGLRNYWQDFLCDFFFEGLGKEKARRASRTNQVLGEVPFLNTELFAPSDRWDDRAVRVDNRVFELLFQKLLNPYHLATCETSPLEVEVAFNQDLLGYGYEELIADQHGQGAYYTHPTEVNLMCRESLRTYLERCCPQVGKELIGRLVYAEMSGTDRVGEKDALVLYQALHEVTVLDPALGSGAFPVAMMKHLFLALRTLGERLKRSSGFARVLREEGCSDPADAFALKVHIVAQSIYGCDSDCFAVQFAKLRLWIELLAACEKPEALPNFNGRLVSGEALVGVVGTDRTGNPITLETLLGRPGEAHRGEPTLHQNGKQAAETLAQLKREHFRSRHADERRSLEQQIARLRDLLLREAGVDPGAVTRTDKHLLWRIDFPEIFAGDRPGFDIVIGNPPYLRSEHIDPQIKTLVNRTYGDLFPELEIRRKCDLYVYFYLRATMLCRMSGVICFICSNSWLDAGYGRALQLHLLTTTKMVGIYESAVQRSFSGADVNTAITVLKTIGKRDEALQERARFVMFHVPFAEVRWGLMREVVSEASSCERKRYRVRVVRQEQALSDGCREPSGARYCGDKWGGRYLRAPIFFQRIITRKRALLCRLGDLCAVSGYIHDMNTGPSFPEVDFIKSVKDVRCLWVTRESAGVVRYGVRAEGSSRLKAPILFPRTLGTRHVIVWNPEGVYGKEFYKIVPQKGAELLVMSQLVSTFGMLQRELMGVTNLGDGALKFSGDDLELFWFVKALEVDKLEGTFAALAQRAAYDYRKELVQEDRRRLDKVIFDALEIDDTVRDHIYKAVAELIGSRLQRAASV